MEEPAFDKALCVFRFLFAIPHLNASIDPAYYARIVPQRSSKPPDNLTYGNRSSVFI
jgi:hypothetical protein